VGGSKATVLLVFGAIDSITIKPMAVCLLGANNIALGNLVELLIILEQFSSIPIRVGDKILGSRRGGRL
jgi:hypothetical protein